MGSYQFLLHPNQVRDSSCSTDIRRGFSKSQMLLQKILRIIASYPPNETSIESSFNREILEFGENKGLGIDLNMGFCPWPEDEVSECLSACSVADKGFSNVSELEFGGVLASEKSSSQGECDPKEIGDQFGTDSLTIEEIGKGSRSIGVSEDRNQDAKVDEEEEKQENIDGDDGRVETTPPYNDRFSLLIEAAEMASGSLEDNKGEWKTSSEAEAEAGQGRRSKESSSSSSKRSSECCGVEESSAVVRSKRGRNQVLPSRYRDSVVLAPWKRVGRAKRVAGAATERGNKLNNNNNEKIKTKS